mmetsp:Transcript_78475/g.156966  ORF Transcript_78475/g.156966 Transcript_78475/m.156966 type:complete len:146 (+) Transcript_78475:1-438(+)
MSIMKMDKKMWRASLFRSAYVAAREIVALFQTTKCRITLIANFNRFCQKRVHPVEWAGYGNWISSSPGGDMDDFGLDDMGLEWNQPDAKMNTSALPEPTSTRLTFGNSRKHKKSSKMSSVSPKWPGIEESSAEDDVSSEDVAEKK